MTGFRLAIEREMAANIPEFLRGLPGALAAGFRAIGCGDAECRAAAAQAASESGPGDEAAPRRLAVHQSGRAVEIALTPQRARRIGALRLHRTKVRLELSGFGESEVGRFLEAFDARYRRGGG